MMRLGSWIFSNSDSEGDVRVVQGDDNAPVRRGSQEMGDGGEVGVARMSVTVGEGEY